MLGWSLKVELGEPLQGCVVAAGTGLLRMNRACKDQGRCVLGEGTARPRPRSGNGFRTFEE